MFEGIVVTVVGGLILAAAIGGVALVRRRIGGTATGEGRRTRSDVRFLAKVTDFGDPMPGVITWRVGLVLDVEVHALRTQPMRITEVGLELQDGTRLPLETASNLNTPIAAPDLVEASDYLQGVRKRVAAAGSPVRGFYAIATPARTFRQGLPRSWKGFPEVVPPPGSK
jgi:hypothetical protein